MTVIGRVKSVQCDREQGEYSLQSSELVAVSQHSAAAKAGKCPCALLDSVMACSL